MTVSLADQIKEAGRELGMRRATYSKWVKGRRMSQAEADQRIAGMDAIYATLKKLQTNPTAIASEIAS